MRLTVPDLDARREDVPLLVAHLLRQHAASDAGVARRFFPGEDLRAMPLVSPGLVEALVQHPYTTHVRELDAILVRAALEGRGRYLELGPELKRDLLVTPPARGTGDDLSTALPPEDQVRLSLLRRHRWSPTACGRDPAYPGNRQTADLHLRQLLCRALQVADWSTARAIDLLVGAGEPELRAKCAARLAKFLANLRVRVEREGADALARALAEEWKSGVEGVLLVVTALRSGRISDPVGAEAGDDLS